MVFISTRAGISAWRTGLPNVSVLLSPTFDFSLVLSTYGKLQACIQPAYALNGCLRDCDK